MKAKIHPNYRQDTKVTCACGNQFETGSTLAEIKVDICSACHPFYTGEMKYVDTQGRVEKFQQKMEKATQQYQSKKQRRNALKDQDTPTTPLSLKQMIEAQRKVTPTKQ